MEDIVGSSKAINRLLGATAIAGVGVFIIVVLSLHMLQPDYDPRHQLMSELALGTHGTWMLLAFFGMAAATGAVAAAALLQLRTSPAGFAFLVASGGFVASGLYPLGAASSLHIASISVAFVFIVLGMYLLPTTSVFGWPALHPVTWSLAAAITASVAAGQAGVALGVAQRLAAASLIAWLLIIGVVLCQERPDA
ncbi:MAG: DUF998 domain-containing protein [Pseudomonadota bacterium]